MAMFLSFLLIGMVGAQVRPFYAPRPWVYPQVIQREELENPVANRVGGEEAVVTGSIMTVGGSIYDKDLNDRVAALPVDKQPFWHLNQQHIQQHIGGNGPAPSSFPSQPPRSSFQARG